MKNIGIGPKSLIGRVLIMTIVCLLDGLILLRWVFKGFSFVFHVREACDRDTLSLAAMICFRRLTF